MKKSKKITTSSSDIAIWRYLSRNLYPKIVVWKNQKIVFSASQRKFSQLNFFYLVNLSVDKVYSAKNVWIATLYPKIGRKNTFDFGAL